MFFLFLGEKPDMRVRFYGLFPFSPHQQTDPLDYSAEGRSVGFWSGFSLQNLSSESRRGCSADGLLMCFRFASVTACILCHI